MLNYLRAFCVNRNGVTLTEDRHGNLLLHVKRGRRQTARPVCITAHVDHPGFVAKRMIDDRTLQAYWRGGVKVDYFRNQRARFYVDDAPVAGRIKSMTTKGKGDRERADVVTFAVSKEVPAGTVGMWALPEPAVRKGRIYARACDDLAGVAACLCAIDTLSKSKQNAEAYFLFTRAEEVGFVGAMAAIKSSTVPKKCFVVVTETSSERPHAPLGDGPILRVGDRVTSFTSAVTGFCGRVADELTKRKKRFKFQRRLMDGGMCEATAFCTLGYEATCACLSLGNYHNMNTKTGKIAPEYIDLSDFENLVDWYIALGQTPLAYKSKDEALIKRLVEIEKENRKLLSTTVNKAK